MEAFLVIVYPKSSSAPSITSNHVVFLYPHRSQYQLW
jgi:hypothetical protein